MFLRSGLLLFVFIISLTSGLRPSWSAETPPKTSPLAFQVAQARVNSAEGLRLRSHPGLYGEILFVIPDNTLLPVSGRSIDRKWLLVTVNGLSGWVSRRLVNMSVSVDDLPVRLPIGLTGRPTFSYANVRIRTSPSFNSRTLYVLPKERPVGALGQSADKEWVLLNYGVGLTGWAYKDFFVDGLVIGKLRDLPIIR